MITLYWYLNNAKNLPVLVARIMRNLLYLTTLLFIFNCQATQVVRTIGQQKADDASYDYFIQLLEKSLTVTNEEYGAFEIKTVPHPGQERVMMLLSAEKFYDVVWSGSSKQRDSKLLKVPFPLFKGGLGWRGSVIRKKDTDKFASMTRIEQLSAWAACQGMHWPDADVLEQNGLAVSRVTHFDSMLQMLVLKRCDYLPLSIFEGAAELALVSDSFEELTFSDEVILSYPMTMNFYVHAGNMALANRLELGLIRLHESGEFERFMRSHSLTKNAFPLSQYESTNVITLSNSEFNSRELEKYGLKIPLDNTKDKN